MERQVIAAGRQRADMRQLKTGETRTVLIIERIDATGDPAAVASPRRDTYTDTTRIYLN